MIFARAAPSLPAWTSAEIFRGDQPRQTGVRYL